MQNFIFSISVSKLCMTNTHTDDFFLFRYLSAIQTQLCILCKFWQLFLGDIFTPSCWGTPGPRSFLNLSKHRMFWNWFSWVTCSWWAGNCAAKEEWGVHRRCRGGEGRCGEVFKPLTAAGSKFNSRLLRSITELQLPALQFWRLFLCIVNILH